MYLQKEMLKLSKVYKERITAFMVKKLKKTMKYIYFDLQK